MITHLGSLALSVLVPIADVSLAQLTSALGPVVAQQVALVGQIAANIDMQVALADPAGIAAQVAAAVAALPIAIADIVSSMIPNLLLVNVQYGFDLAAIVGIATSVGALISTISAVLSTGGIHAYTIDSTAAGVGAEISSVTAGGLPGGAGAGAGVKALLLVTESPTAWAALSVLLKTA